jgi:enoyl-[acyl-carrier protein] reductase I
MAQSLSPLMMEHGGSIVTLDFDNSTQAWPFYDWMGVCKAALESVTRYLARDLGKHQIRVNALAAGPLRTMAAKGIPGFERFESSWGQRAPLGWNSEDRTPVAKMAAVLLSDFSSATTGEIVHVDGGYHAMGAEVATEPPD